MSIKTELINLISKAFNKPFQVAQNKELLDYLLLLSNNGYNFKKEMYSPPDNQIIKVGVSVSSEEKNLPTFDNLFELEKIKNLASQNTERFVAITRMQKDLNKIAPDILYSKALNQNKKYELHIYICVCENTIHYSLDSNNTLFIKELNCMLIR